MAQLKNTTIDGDLIVNGKMICDDIAKFYSSKTNGILENGSDLNDLTTYNGTGFYAVTGDRTYLNMPPDVTWGILKVIMTTEDSWVLQEFFGLETLHTRFCANGQWSNWVQH